MSTDSEIVRRSLSDPPAFGDLFDRHAAAIHRYAARRAGPTVADDVVSQTFLVAFERRGSYDLAREGAAPWLYGIATNLLRRHRRDEARLLRALQRDGPEQAVPDPAERVADRLDAGRTVAEVAAALRAMPRPRRDVLLLAAWADLTYEQIGEALDVPVGTVRSRLSRARAELRGAATPTTATTTTAPARRA